MRAIGAAVLLLILARLPVSAQTDAQKAFADALGKSLKKNIVTLRSFDERNELSFDAAGNPQGTSKLGTWIFDSKIEVSGVRMKPDHLEIEGKRLWVASGAKDKWKYIRSGDRARVRIEIAPNEEPQKIQAAINRVFVPATESMANLVPEEWKGFFRGEQHQKPAEDLCKGCSEVIDGVTVYRVGGGVTPPRAIHAPDPAYDDRARQSKYQGTVVLWAIVTPEGRLEKVAIQRALGLGLDEKAVEAVRTWTFEPATKNGVPVASQINIEVTFRLY